MPNFRNSEPRPNSLVKIENRLFNPNDIFMYIAGCLYLFDIVSGLIDKRTKYPVKNLNIDWIYFENQNPQLHLSVENDKLKSENEALRKEVEDLKSKINYYKFIQK